MLAWMQKLIAMLLSITALFSAAFHIPWGDGMQGHEFPLIEATQKADGDVRVMSVNVRCEDNNGVPRVSRKHLVIKEILKLAPDSFGVQEATPEWMASLTADLPTYGCVGVARDNGRSVARIGESCAVFYLKEKLELLDHGDFWLSETPETPSLYPGAGCNRLCTWALFRVKATGAEYLHLNSHFDNVSAEARAFGARQICEFINSRFKNVPTVFTADLNSTEGGGAYRIMTQLLADARYTAADSVGWGTFHECTPETYGEYVLDYIFCSPDITANVFRTVTDGIEGRFISDHFPLYADLTVRFADANAGHDFPLIPPQEKAAGDVRVMSYNIRCGDVRGVSQERRTAIGVQQIREVLPDSVGIQECTAEWMAALKERLPEYGWVGVERETGKPADTGWESCPIFYNKTVYRLVDHGDFWLSATPDEPSLGEGAACKRVCTWAVLRNRATGKTYVHVNTHYDHISEAARVYGARQVISFIESNFPGLPVVFTADMNTQVESETYEIMTELLSDARFTASDAVSYGTFHAASPETHADDYIDFVMCSKNIPVRAYRTVTAGVDGRMVSDHFPIYADIVL